MQLHKGSGIRNSIPKGASTRTRLRVRRYERKIHESVLRSKDFMEIKTNLEQAMVRCQHLLG